MRQMKMSETQSSRSPPKQGQSQNEEKRQKCDLLDHEQQSGEKSSSMFCLKWNGFANQVQAGLASIFGSQELVDVTLASCDGQRIRAHKIILAMSSPFFRRILKDNPCKHPIVIISGIKFRHVEHVIRFIYMGEVRMREDEVEDFIDAAESLKIDGISSTVNQFDVVERSETDELPGRTGVIKRNETITSSPQFGRSKSLVSTNDHEQQSQFGCTSPSGSLSVRPSSHPTFNPTATPTSPWRSPSSSAGAIGSSWSSSHSHPRIHPHSRISDALENRAESSSSSGSPGVIVELREGSTPPIIPRLLLSRPGSSPQPRKSSTSISGEDYSTSGTRADEKAYELSLPDIKINSRETSPRGGPSLLAFSPLHSPRSLQSLQPFPPRPAWPMEFGYPAPAFRTPHYLPLSLVAASAILTNQSLPQCLPPVTTPISMALRTSPSSTPVSPLKLTTTPSKSPVCTSTASMDHYRRQMNSRNPSSHSTSTASNSSGTGGNHSSHSSRNPPSSLSTLRAKLTASMFSHGNSPHFIKPNSRGGLSSSSSKPRSRTTTIRSSQVPQSARYTASEVDEMVERVENFPGPLVPCTICQKFVKRERLRAHIHECHLLQGESIICPHCGIGLKSKGSFRVHIWRHKRGSLGVKRLKDHNLPP